MLKILIKKQLKELFRSYYIDKKTNKLKSKKDLFGFIILLIIIFGTLGIAFYSLSVDIAKVLVSINFDDLYFSVLGLISIALGVFGSVFNTYSSLYLPKDNDLLLSMPIKPKNIILARLVGVYVISLMYSGIVWIPVTIAYFVYAKLTILNVLLPIINLFIVALFVTILSCILGYVVALISNKTKSNNLFKILASLGIMILYYILYFNAIDKLQNLVTQVDKVDTFITKWLHYINLIGKSSSGNIISFILLTVITILLAILCLLVINKSFVKLTTTKENSTKLKNKENKYILNTKLNALIKREYKHFYSISSWVLNGAFGLLMMLVGAVYLLFNNNLYSLITKLYESVPFLKDVLPVAVFSIIALLITTCQILPASISLEGKTLWQLKSLPISEWDILKSKELMFIKLAIIPSIFLLLVASILLKFSPIIIILLIIMTILYLLIYSDFSLIVNLKDYNLDWVSPTVVIKQGMPVFITMFGGWIFCILIDAVGYFLTKMLSGYIITIIVFIILLIIAYIIHNYLKNKGTKLLKEI